VRQSHFNYFGDLTSGFSGRSYSVSGFEFDLLPLSASVADPEIIQGENAGEKSIGLVNGGWLYPVFFRR
jgi:hypothetical protein